MAATNSARTAAVAVPRLYAVAAPHAKPVRMGRERNAGRLPRPGTCPYKVPNARPAALLSIYVEISIRGALDELWRRTQDPELHERWDLRFTSIEYLERADESPVQLFRYTTCNGLGREIEGWGKTVGERLEANTRTSAFKFGSDDWRSLIRAGSGYWKYEQIGDEVRFVTGYNYDVRWGLFGRIFDRILFRPLLGWATAWSFDRLRLWIEQEKEPQQAARQVLIHAVAAAALALLWIWQGLVPKLWALHPAEVELSLASGIPESMAPSFLRILGAAEVVLGVAFPFFARRRWPWLLTVGSMAGGLLVVLFAAPDLILGPFSPLVLNLSMAALSVIGLMSLRNLPSARRCLRRLPEEQAEVTRT